MIVACRPRGAAAGAMALAVLLAVGLALLASRVAGNQPSAGSAAAGPVPAETTTQAATALKPRVITVTARDLPCSYRPGCPVGPSQLRL